MVWISVRVQAEAEETAGQADFTVAALKLEDTEEWFSIPPSAAADLKALIKRKFPKKSVEDFIIEGEVKVNAQAMELEKILQEPGTLSPSDSENRLRKNDGKERGDSREGSPGKEGIPTVVLHFARAFAKEVMASSSTEKKRAKPSVFNGTSDKLTPQTWMNHFERFVGDQDCFERVMMLREYLSGVALTWYHATLSILGTGVPWSEWKTSFSLAFTSDSLRDAEHASRYAFKEESGSLLEYIFEKQRLLLRANPETSERSMVQAVLLGLPFYLRQQFKILRSETMSDIMRNVGVVSVKSKRYEPEKKKTGGDVNVVYAETEEDQVAENPEGSSLN